MDTINPISFKKTNAIIAILLFCCALVKSGKVLISFSSFLFKHCLFIDFFGLEEDIFSNATNTTSNSSDPSALVDKMIEHVKTLSIKHLKEKSAKVDKANEKEEKEPVFTEGDDSIEKEREKSLRLLTHDDDGDDDDDDDGKIDSYDDDSVDGLSFEDESYDDDDKVGSNSGRIFILKRMIFSFSLILFCCCCSR